MDWLVYLGTAVCLAGIGGVVFCLLRALQVQKSSPDDAEIRRRLQLLIPVNYGSVLGAILGLFLVVLGLLF